MSRKSFPQTASMPLIRVQITQPSSDDIPMRSIETENLNSLAPTLSPFTNRFVDPKSVGNWTPISISSESSDNEDEKNDRVDQPLHGEFFLNQLIIIFLS